MKFEEETLTKEDTWFLKIGRSGSQHFIAIFRDNDPTTLLWQRLYSQNSDKETGFSITVDFNHLLQPKVENKNI